MVLQNSFHYTMTVLTLSFLPLALSHFENLKNYENSLFKHDSFQPFQPILEYPDHLPTNSLISPNYTLNQDTSCSISPSYLPENINSSISSGFNFPLNEHLPNNYFWSIYPEQIRLSYTEKPNEMRITWVTYTNILARVAYRSTLCPESLQSTNWTIIKASISQFDEGTSFIRIQYINTIVLKDIKKTCSYEYLVGNGIFWSEMYTFRGKTPYQNRPLSYEDTQIPVKMIVIGDWGGGMIGIYTKDMLEADLRVQEADWALHLGDFAYDLNDREGQQGDDWLNMIQRISANIPYMTIPGNHEIDYNYTHYINRFKMPVNDANEGKGFFYSYNMGPAHFVMINLEQYFEVVMEDCIETHKNWLIEDLKTANSYRNEVPWIIVFAHHSFYCSVDKSECNKQARLVKDEFEEVFYNNSVDLIIQAHVHNYERDKVIYKEQVLEGELDTFNMYFNPRAPVYVVNGNAGNFHEHNDPFKNDLPDFYLFGSQDYGYGRLNVLNFTHLFYEQYSSAKHTQIDYFWLIKDKIKYN